jgi:hypothetical protein
MNPPTRLCYLISSPKGFLLGFDYNETQMGLRGSLHLFTR